jgi:hypothetical protein
MPFQFPDPSVSTTATLPNGEIWEYLNGAWQARPTQDDDQQQIDALDTRVDTLEDEVDAEEVISVGLLSDINSLQVRLSAIEGLDVQSAVSALAIAQQDIIDLKSKVNTLELTSFLILE